MQRDSEWGSELFGRHGLNKNDRRSERQWGLSHNGRRNKRRKNKKEKISLVLRSYFRGAVHESFLHFESADRLDAAWLTDKIIHILESHGLEYKNNLVGQAYDGASVMSGKHSDVQARIKEQAKHAFYIHCSAHCLNLVLVDTVKAVPEAGQFFSLLERLYVFTSGSYVHQKWFSIQRDVPRCT